MIEIRKVQGYGIFYESRSRRFIVQDSDGAQVALAETEDGAEAKIKTLCKQEFKRIPVIRVLHDGEIQYGELTSINRDDLSSWVSMMTKRGSERSKISLNYDHDFYEATPKNMELVKQIAEQKEIIDKAKKETATIIRTLESRINMAYFGITRSF